MRRGLGVVSACATGALAVLTALRWELARRVLAERPALMPAPEPFAPGDVDVLIPVRAGDPLLAERLAASVASLGGARVHLLVDDDDAEARAVAAALAERSVVVEFFPPPTPGRNPKVEKLAAAVARIESRGDARQVLVQLDDDTSLPPGGLAGLLRGLSSGADGSSLDRAGLATAIPVYLEQGSVWSRLVAGFVNGSALVTYLPLARLAPPVSVNGMALAMRASDLARVGGYESIWAATCDDYALARAFRRHGLGIAQTAQPVLLATTVTGPGEYLRIMRRWLLFATEVVRRDASVSLLLMAGLPSVLPLGAVVLAALAPRRSRGAAMVAALGVVVGSHAATRHLRHTFAGLQVSSAGLVYEVAAALLTPLHLLGTLGSRTVTWRGRRVRVGVGE